MEDRENSSSISTYNFCVKILVLSALFFVARVLFFCCNYHLLKSISPCLLAQAFFVGARIDLATIFTLNLPIFILWFLPIRLKSNVIVAKSLDLLFFGINFLALLVNVVDAKYFSFSFRRLSGDIFSETVLLTENPEVYLKMIEQFWCVTLVGLSIFIALCWASFRLPVTKKTKKIPWREYAYFVAFVALCVICVRGGLQGKPLKPGDTFACTQEPTTASLANNSAFNIFHTRKKESVRSLVYFSEDDPNLMVCSPRHHPKSPLFGKFRGKNVFVLILESFSGEYVGAIDRRYKKEGAATFTPFLDSLIKKSYTFDAFANGRISVNALTSVATGVPSLFDSTFIVSRYAENNIVAWPKLLGDQGYQTLFFYGGKRNSCHFDSVRVKAGMRSYFCCEDYDGPSKDMRAWGVYDDRFFQFVAKKVNETKEPFVSMLFTLSSHHPFCYPEEFNGQFPKHELILPEFIAYADYSLRKFFETAEKMDWYKDTIFILVADHTAAHGDHYYVNNLGRY